MGEQCDHHHRKKEKQKAACAVCTLLLILLIMLLIILYFTVLKPKNPKVQVPVMRMVSYYSAAGAAANVTALRVGLSLQVYMYNPNRGDFYIERGSTACILYGSEQMGLADLPDNTRIPSQSFVTISVDVGMQKPILLNLSTISSNDKTVVPISTIVTILGHVTNAGMFSHHSTVVSVCDVGIRLGSPMGYLQPYICKKSYSLNA